MMAAKKTPTPSPPNPPPKPTKPGGRERSIPDYLEGREAWTKTDFVVDALRHGYTKAQAERFAAQYLWKLGKLVLTPPEVEGFKPSSDMPVFKDGGQVAFLYRSTTGRRVFRFYTLAGQRVGPDHAALAAAVVWQMKSGWVSI